MNTAAVPGPRPKESLFYAPVVYLIGKLSGFKPYVGVESKLIRDDALRLAGIDPEDCPWPLQSTSSKKRDGLYRVVHFGWYHQTRQYRAETEALCCRPNDPVTRGKRGYWALTDLGVKKAKALREVYEGQIRLSAGPNATARYIGDNWERLYDKMVLALRRKMPRSEALGKVEDHVMDFFEKKIRTDGLSNHINKGKPLAPSTAAGWARKSAYTDIRNEGRNPVCRLFHGALTPKEIKQLESQDWTETVMPRTINESDVLQHNQYAAHSENDFLSDAHEKIQDTSIYARPEDAVVGADAFDACLNQVSQILAETLSEEHDAKFHYEVLHARFVKEMTVREIAEIYGMERDERSIKSAINRARDAMLQARDHGSFAEFLPR